MHNHSHDPILENHGTIQEELLCHFPYALFSVALSIIVLSLIAYSGLKVKESRQLFHSFHFLHILFSATGAVLIFRKYSSSWYGALVCGITIPTVFCTLSDTILPFLGGWYLGLDMHFHWCFVSHITTILPFLITGVFNGYVVSSHVMSQQLYYSTTSHFLHIFLSSLASLFYLVSYGFNNWNKHIGFVFMLLIVAVLIPCTLSDIVVPMGFARFTAKKRSSQTTETVCNQDQEASCCMKDCDGK